MLKYLTPIILFAHGFIHIIGFAKAFNYANVTQLTKEISKPNGMLWLLTATLFTVAGVLCLLKKESWVYLAFIAIVSSQVLIIYVWQDAKFGTVLNVIILLVAIASWSTYFFEWKFKADAKNGIEQTNIAGNTLLTDADISYLPAPVKKYIRYAGVIGKEKVKNMKIIFNGEMRDKGKPFFKFNTVQYNFFNNPTRLFFMKAKMHGITVPIYHCYKNSTATMQVKLFGLFNVVNVKGNEMNKAETVTVFNDMCLMAPASLIDKRIVWTAIDNLSAQATFTNGINKITATLYFNEQGQLINFISDDRYAVNEMKQYRFSTPVKNYIQIDGRNIIQYGETVWHYPEGEFVYGKFTLKSIEYNVKEL